MAELMVGLRAWRLKSSAMHIVCGPLFNKPTMRSSTYNPDDEPVTLKMFKPPKPGFEAELDHDLLNPLGPPLYVIYARFSDEMQTTDSIENQVRRCREFLAAKGFNPDQFIVIKDEDESGLLVSRPGWDLVLRLMRHKRLLVLISAEQARIGRADIAVPTVRDIVYYGGRFLTVLEGIDTNEDGWTNRVRLADFQHSSSSEHTSVRVQGGLRGRVLDGDGSAGDFPWGYTSKHRDSDAARLSSNRRRIFRKDIIIFEPAASIIRLIFGWFIGGMRMAAIARKLNSMGDKVPPNRRGRRNWKGFHVHQVLTTIKYTGRWDFGKTKTLRNGAGKPRAAAGDPKRLLTVNRPNLRIIEQDTWLAAQELLAKLKQTFGPHEGEKRRGPTCHYTVLHEGYLTWGLIYCSVCGARLVIRGSSKSPKSLGCPNHANDKCSRRTGTPLEPAEQKVSKIIGIALTADDGLIDLILSKMRSKVEAASADRLALHRQITTRLTEITEEMANISTFIRKGKQSAFMEGQLLELEQEEVRLKKEQKDAGVSRAVELPSREWILKRLRSLQDSLHAGEVVAYTVLRKFIGKIMSEPVTEPGKRNGYSRIRFRFNLPSLIHAIIAQKLPAGFQPLLNGNQVMIEQEEFVIDLGQPSRADTKAKVIYELRTAGDSWRIIREKTGVAHGNAYPLYLRYKAAVEGDQPPNP